MWQVVLSGSDCEFVEPQTFDLSRKRKAGVVLESETETTMEAEDENPP